MKSVFTKLAVILLMLPTLAFADVKSDMSNPNISLVAVMQNAMAGGMSAGDTVKAMIKTDPSLASSIVATGMIVAPAQYAAIISAAIDAGVSADTVVAAALIASDGKNADNVIAAAVSAAPGQKDAIVAASVRALPQTASGLTAVAGSPIRATTAQASGGGASVTASDVSLIRSTLAQVETELAAAGFTAAEVASAVNNLTAALTDSQSDVATATSSLVQIQADLVAAQAASIRVVELEAEVAALSDSATTAEAEVDASIAAAVSVVSTTKKAGIAVANAQADAEAVAETNADVTAAKADFDAASGDLAATKAVATAKKTAAQTKLSALGDEAAVSAEATAAQTAADAAADQDARIDLDISKVQSAIAALETAGVGSVSESGVAVVTVKGQSLAQLQASLTALLGDKVNVDLAGATAKVRALRKTLKQVQRLKAIVAVYEAVEQDNDIGAAQGRVGQLLTDGDTEAALAAAIVTNQLIFQGTATTAQQAEINKLNATIAALSETVKKLSVATTEKAVAEDTADLNKLADKISDAITSVATS